MEDTVIINLYFDRSEKAIQATEEKYSRYCLVLLGMFCMIKKTPMNVSMIHG